MSSVATASNLLLISRMRETAYHIIILLQINNIYKLTVCFFFYQTLSRPEKLSSQGHILEAAIEAAATEVVNLRDNLNEWDSKVGDGDCGSTVGLRVAYVFPFICSPCYLHLITPFSNCRCSEVQWLYLKT